MIRALLALLIAAHPAQAVGPEDDTPPAPTPTTMICDAGRVWDTDTRSCVPIEESTFREEDLRRTARELAYAGRSDDALALLARSVAPDSSETLTLVAFAHGRAGRIAIALDFYRQAIDADAGNLLARAYMGLALIADGREEDAYLQLSAIRDRGGAGSWADRALMRALAAGVPIGY